jgi:transcription elongation factor GreB
VRINAFHFVYNSDMKKRPTLHGPRAPYITPEGAARLREEFRYLWHVKRPQVTQAVSDAAALGDRSENAEYIYGKKQLREIDRRLRYLGKRLDVLVVVDKLPDNPSKVFFGAWVGVEDEDGTEHRYRIVGGDETDAAGGHISIDSPLARALLGKAVDDEATVPVPGGTRRIIITAIDYAGAVAPG